MMRVLLLVLVLALAAGCTTDVDDPVFDNPNDPDAVGPLPAPEAITVALGDNQVVLAWDMPADSDPADRFAVYRRLIAPLNDATEGEERLLTVVTGTTHWDRTARNGRRYGYRIAAATGDGPFGARSLEVEALPALFSIAVANNLPRVGSQQVNVSLNAPSGTEAVLVSEDPSLTGATFVRAAGSITVTLSPGDGEKTVYAKFRMADGAESVIVSDDVLLDTRAVIRSVAFDGPAARVVGETVHFRLDAGEPDGDASLDVESIFNGLTLFDDGTEGDPVADDGVYERTVELPAGRVVTEGTVSGRFTDAVGNAASPALAGRTLTVARPPDAVSLVDYVTTVPPASVSATLRWSRSQDREFDAYRLYRSDSPDVGEGDELAASTTGVSTTELSDGAVAEGKTYYYRVYVRNRAGLSTGSNVLEVPVPNLRPPTRIELNIPDGVGETSLGLRWAASGDRDFAAYRLHRSGEPGVTAADPAVVEIRDVYTTLYFDNGLVENTQYYYRLYVIDIGGLETAGAEILTRTRNVPPPGVAMNAAANVDTTAATLSWEASDAHDFAAYRLYRDRGPGVGTFSSLVAEIPERETTVYRDTGLEKNTTYYYRVFVVDDGVTPGPESTGSTGSAVMVKTQAK